jgi:hypothetical protein
MQRHMDEMMHQMGLSDLYFVITAELASKVSSLSWKAHPEDLSQGIHPFTVGEVNPDAIITPSKVSPGPTISSRRMERR